MTIIELKRKEKDYTQQHMAKEIGVSIGCYNMYENNQRKVPIEKAKKISEIFECELTDLFTPNNFTAEIVAKEIK